MYIVKIVYKLKLLVLDLSATDTYNLNWQMFNDLSSLKFYIHELMYKVSQMILEGVGTLTYS